MEPSQFNLSKRIDGSSFYKLISDISNLANRSLFSVSLLFNTSFVLTIRLSGKQKLNEFMLYLLVCFGEYFFI